MDRVILEQIVAELVTRPRHEKVRTHLHSLLRDGLGASSTDIDFETHTPEVRGRIDALLGSTVFEVKTDLRRERHDAETQLARYLPQKEAETGRRYIGVATDGAAFQAYELREGELEKLGEEFRPTPEAPRELLGWLESVVDVQERLPPDIHPVRLHLGRESVAYQRAMRDLGAVWAEAAGRPEARLKRDLWNRLLSVAYGADVGDEPLFLQHTYLTIVAKAIATLALTDRLPEDPAELMAGTPFRDRGIVGAVEGDFFDWVLIGERGRDLTAQIARHAARFDFARVDVDILKGLYESLIDPAQRHDLGEYYTPDWLAARIVAHAVREPLTERVIDPACGSGTFLFHAVRRAIEAAEAAGRGPADAIALATEKVAGIDVHPVAVIFARATYLLALAPTLRRGRPSTVSVPVYLGDALQWSAREFMGEHDLEIVVPAEGERGPGLPDDDPDKGRIVLRFPFDAAEDPGFFDEALQTMLRFGEQDLPASAFRGWLDERGARAVETLLRTYRDLKGLQKSGRNHIWGYVARNLSRPIWLASEARKADVVVGNPPWVSYRSMSQAMQRRFRDAATAAGLFVGGKSATANDLSAYFFARAAGLYMKRTGRIAFVMPYAAMSREPYRLFRTGKFKEAGFQGATVRFTEAWAFPADVQPLFPVPACVLFAERSQVSRPLPETVRVFSGFLPRRDAHEDEAARALAEAEEPWPADDGVQRAGSPYRARFRQGATLVPRRLVIVEEVPVRDRLGGNPAAPLVRGRVSNQDKRPWSEIPPPEGPVERQFLHPVLLGESIAPFRVLAPVLGVIPMAEGRDEPLDAAAAGARGYHNLAAWLKEAEGLWDRHGSGRMKFLEQIDYYGKLRCQFPISPVRIVFAKAGTNAASVVIRDQHAVFDHMLYWMAARDLNEANYLCAIFNSETTRSRVERWQSTGQWGARHFDKVMFNLPIPLFDPSAPLHAALAEAAARAERLAAEVPLREAEHFTRARRRIRDALTDAGVAAEIDAVVAELLDGTVKNDAGGE